MPKTKLGTITVGQAPRNDMVPEIKEVLGQGFEILQAGALDDYSYQEVINELAPVEGDDVLVSRMRDGEQVVFAEKYIIPLIQKRIDKLSAQGVDVILMLCTGKFPDFKFSGMIIEPQPVLHRLVAGLNKDKPLGIIIPEQEQIEQVRTWWSESGVEVRVKAASPYKGLDNIKMIAREFKNSSVQNIFLDCMGYNRKMKSFVQVISKKQVILPRTMIAAIIKELFII